MRYLPTSDPLRQRMLAELGLPSVDELFSHIPAYCRLNRSLNIPPGQAEADILAYFKAAAAANAPGFTSFLGAGAYHHFRPAHLDNLIGRGEWFTAYTPYQPEIAQGTLQSIFEFQTMICQLTGQEVANAGMYDGSTALNEACMMAARVTGRSGLVVARSVHPQYRQVLRTLTQFRDFPTAEVGFTPAGTCDWDALRAAVSDSTAAVAIQSPNFFGNIEDWEAAAEIAHARGALLVAVITDPVSLGLLPPPSSADIVAMELQGFGIPVGFGGPYAGILASRQKFVRSLPGRLVGEARDPDGRRGFVLTLSTREQHIRREKATSNICTAQALNALAGVVYLSWLGREGLVELAELLVRRSDYARERLCAIEGVSALHRQPVVREFAVSLGLGDTAGVRRVIARCAGDRIEPGYALGRDYPEYPDGLLVAVSERRS
ncbi:MAG TPA: aminomethyl-transferring glycine dehydrogenase subunit GcvPA, partial [Terriglobales bacterium]|nr:aminomethyl-transferring glycine dehydrogenase subunit GcvPA [Terriglobales bacterium]